MNTDTHTCNWGSCDEPAAAQTTDFERRHLCAKHAEWHTNLTLHGTIERPAAQVSCTCKMADTGDGENGPRLTITEHDEACPTHGLDSRVRWAIKQLAEGSTADEHDKRFAAEVIEAALEREARIRARALTDGPNGQLLGRDAAEAQVDAEIEKEEDEQAGAWYAEEAAFEVAAEAANERALYGPTPAMEADYEAERVREAGLLDPQADPMPTDAADDERCPVCGLPDNCGDCTHPSVRYVNAYEVTLGYGGPEEGGWWYDVGTPLASIPFRTPEEEKAARALAERCFAAEYEARPGKSSTHPDAADLAICTEDDMAAVYPETRPFYE